MKKSWLPLLERQNYRTLKDHHSIGTDETIHRKYFLNASKQPTKEAQKLFLQCLRMFANPKIPLKDLKSSMEISDHTKSKIFENRMDNAAYKLNRVANELDREKHEKEMLKKQLTEKFVAHNRTAFGAGMADRDVDKSMMEHRIAKSIPSTHSQHYSTYKRHRERKQIQHMVNTINTPRI